MIEFKARMGKVRTRFAPSPTGFLHIGGLRTALYAYALAKHEGGDFILRIEDTDKKREVEGSSDALQNTLKKFGLGYDELYIQSERLPYYEKCAKQLVSDGHAFYCECTPKNAKEQGFSNELRDPCRDKNLTAGAIKLKVPDGQIVTYHDFVHKKDISWNTDTVYDATLFKSDGYPTYHLAAMADDIDMKISHIIRGHDWLPSTPIHLLVFDYLGGDRPQIGHPTDILSAETGKKLSKRRDSVFAEQFLEEGYLPEALLNFIMLLGWASKDNNELFTLEEFVSKFDINGFQESNPKFLRDKLDWFNGQYIRQKSDDDLAKLLIPFAEGVGETEIKKVLPFIKDRIKKLSDFDSFAGFIFKDSSKITPLKLTDNFDTHIGEAIEALGGLDSWDLDSINEVLNKLIEAKGFKVGDFYMDLRGVVAGSRFTPPINESMEVIGKEEVILRLKKGLE